MSSELEDFIRSEEGRGYTSGWLRVDQDLIDRFADTTRDWMFLHVDPEKAAQTEFGGTIAHGFLLLSLLAPLRGETPRPRLPGMRTGVNYGFDKVRFISPVRSGSRIRAHFTVTELRRDGPRQVREAMDVTLEVEGVERPAVVARWLTMYLL
ncbi:MAG: MaoC family dehydratase [Novosphingobium sp.]